MAKIRANDHYVPPVADPLSPITFVNKINVPVFMACQWTDEQTGGHCPDLAEHFTGTNRKWFTFTNGTHVDSLDPATFNRWYDFLELYVAQQAPIVNSAAIHAAAPVIYQEAMGITGRDAAARPDPAAADLRDGAGGVRAAAADPRPVRQRRRRPAAGPARTRASSSRGRASRSRAPRPDPGTSAPSGALARRPPAAARGRRVHLERARPAADRLQRRHRRGLRRPVDRDAHLPVGAEPAGQRRLLPDEPADRNTTVDRRRRRARSGCAPRRPTSTSRRRSARSGPTARRPSCRTAGCGPTSASSTPPRARRSSRC